jgi:mRNA-degrading endonuclease toxin of MazEF toxin-antitoxin module
VIVCPITTRERRINTRVRVDPPEGGLSETSFVIPEQIRSVSDRRLKERTGVVSPSIVDDVSRILSVLFWYRR